MSIRREAQPQSIHTVRDWYEGMAESIREHRTLVLDALRTGADPTSGRFLGMIADEVDEWFADQREELDKVTILSLMASAEASLHADFNRRLASKPTKDRLSKAFHALVANLRLKFGSPVRPSLDKDILQTLKDNGVDAHLVSDFRDAMKLRHWLAHGRYWGLNLGRSSYGPDDIYRIADALLSALLR